MEKDFDRWNESKKKINQINNLVGFHTRDIWWCSIGVNIGSEQHSLSVDFSRPVLIVKKFTHTIFLGIPLTTKIKKEQFRINFYIDGVENDALLLQMRVFDSRRLIRKIAVISETNFYKINNALSGLFTPNATETPLGVSSEAEANVCILSIEHRAILSRFYGDRFSDRLRIYSNSNA